MSDPVPALIWCPFPDRQSACDVARTLLDEALIGCANISGDLHAIFDWNGGRGEATETGVLLKTNSRVLDRAIARLAELHPYDEPAILGWRCDAAAPGTTAWLGGLQG